MWEAELKQLTSELARLAPHSVEVCELDREQTSEQVTRIAFFTELRRHAFNYAACFGKSGLEGPDFVVLQRQRDDRAFRRRDVFRNV